MSDRDDFAWAIGHRVPGPGASLATGARIHAADGGADAPRESIADGESIESAVQALALRLDAESGVLVQVRAAMTALERAAQGARNAGHEALAQRLDAIRSDLVRDVAGWMERRR